jgi:hypothetical protein
MRLLYTRHNTPFTFVAEALLDLVRVKKSLFYGDSPPIASRRKPYDKPFENNRVAPMRVELDLA